MGTRPLLLLLGVPPLLLLGLRAAVGPEIAGYHVDTESCSGLVHDNVTAQRISCAAFLDMLNNLTETAKAESAGLARRLRLAVDAGTGWVCPQPQPCTPPCLPPLLPHPHAATPSRPSDTARPEARLRLHQHHLARCHPLCRRPRRPLRRRSSPDGLRPLCGRCLRPSAPLPNHGRPQPRRQAGPRRRRHLRLLRRGHQGLPALPAGGVGHKERDRTGDAHGGRGAAAQAPPFVRRLLRLRPLDGPGAGQPRPSSHPLAQEQRHVVHQPLHDPGPGPDDQAGLPELGGDAASRGGLHCAARRAVRPRRNPRAQTLFAHMQLSLHPIGSAHRKKARCCAGRGSRAGRRARRPSAASSRKEQSRASTCSSLQIPATTSASSRTARRPKIHDGDAMHVGTCAQSCRHV
eukprot:COSAG04_NODE_260_length_18679_cov_4.566439_7_plen_405_part_00